MQLPPLTFHPFRLADSYPSLTSVFIGGLVLAVTLKPKPQEGFGVISTNNVMSNSTKWTLVGIVVVSNLAQLLLSFGYLLFNNTLTRMVTSQEYAQFAAYRKTVRVSAPLGQQRTTYWLQLPYRYILPFMATMAVLHWTTSRSLFLIDITLYNNPDHPPGWTYIAACGYSANPIIVSFAIALAIGFVLLGLANRKVSRGMPVIGTCSWALSAAVHPDPREEDPALKPLMYGVIPSAGINEHGFNQVGFSSNAVTPLVDGRVYS